MSTHCVHGFRVAECASCHPCPHGLVISRCARCAAAARAPRTKRSSAPEPSPQPEKYAGFEIFYAPDVSGWRFRAPDAAPSALSYRSAFLARKAVDEAQEDKSARGARRSA